MEVGLKKFTQDQRNLLITILGIVNFLICSTLSMQFYTGGTLENPDITGYTFISNKLSDLGMTTAYSGKSNAMSFWLFNISLVITGISLIPFILVFCKELETYPLIIKNQIKWFRSIGIFAAINFSLVGMTPKNLPWVVVLHTIVQDLAFIGLFTFQIGAILLLKQTHLSKLQSRIFKITVILQGIYFLFLFRILPGSNEVHCIAQKIIVYSQLLVFLIQSLIFLSTINQRKEPNKYGKK